MTPESFSQWLAATQAAGKARSDAECGRLLGITARQVLNMKRHGVGSKSMARLLAYIERYGVEVAREFMEREGDG